MNKKIREKILVTGCSGFIGMHLCIELCEKQYIVFGIDSLNDYYDPSLKYKRLEKLKKLDNFSFKKVDISTLSELKKVFNDFMPDKVVNLAAQAGVRYSLVNPHSYIKSNVNGFMNLLECCVDYDVEGLIYASSSSVYGASNTTPFSEYDNVDSPSSIYAATKKSNELMAKAYNGLYGLKSTGLRFFTVYGPWGRPDMAYYIFTKNILSGKVIKLYNHGKMERDFTYIDDIIFGVRSAIEKNYDFEIINLGNSKSENLLDMVNIIERLAGKKAKTKLEPIQKGELLKTHANIDKAKSLLTFEPKINIEEGLSVFVKWFMNNMS